MLKKTGITLLIILIILAMSNSSITWSTAGNALAPATFGNTTVGNVGIRLGANKDANRFQLTENGTIESITVYFVNWGFNAKAAIYADSNGRPDGLIAQSDSAWITETGWNTFAIPQKLLSLGYYWLSVISDRSKAFIMVNSDGSAQHVMAAAYFASEFETSFGASNWAVSGSTSIYAIYIPAPPPPSPPTPTPLPPPSPDPAPPPSSEPTPLPPEPTPIPSPSPEPTPPPSPEPAPSPQNSSETPPPIPPPVTSTSFGVYWDQAYTNKASSMTWGTLAPGATKQIVLYVRNEGNTPITLYKATTNWNPSNAANFLTLNWDYNSQPLTAGSAMKITLTLAVSIYITTIKDFGFDTTITATG